MSLQVPDAVRRRAELVGAHTWLQELAVVVDALVGEWGLRGIDRCFPDATEAYAARVICPDGTPAVLKIAVPQGRVTEWELTALRLADGHGSVRVLRADTDHGALLLERLGPSMHDLSLPTREREQHLVRSLQELWRPVHAPTLPSTRDMGEQLIAMIDQNWRVTGRRTPEYVVRGAQQAARNRVSSQQCDHPMLLHGDAQQWNALQSGAGFTLIDPDGVMGEREYDLAVLVREDPLDPAAEPSAQARRLAQETGTDPDVIWEWSVAQRVNTGLLLLALGCEDEGGQMLQAAQLLADQPTR